jgi:hypothetical protein
MLSLAAAVQAAPPAPPTPPEATGQKVVSEVVVIRKDDKDAPKEKMRVEQRKVIIMQGGKDHADAATHAEHMAHMHGDHAMIVAKCYDGSQVTSDSATGEKDGKKTETRIMVCAKGENRLAALEQAQKRIAENKDIPDDVRSNVLAQLGAEIARLKAVK